MRANFSFLFNLVLGCLSKFKSTKMDKNKCHICNQEFDQMSLNVHVATLHPNAKKQQKCEICEKVFKTKNKFLNHLRIVHDNKDEVFTCNICTKTYQTQISLDSHIKTFHEGQKDFKCESCD